MNQPNNDFAPHIKSLLEAGLTILKQDERPITLQFAAMDLAWLDAHRAYHENRGGDSLKSLGSFWNIYLGFLSEEPEYAAKAKHIFQGHIRL